MEYICYSGRLLIKQSSKWIVSNIIQKYLLRVIQITCMIKITTKPELQYHIANILALLFLIRTSLNSINTCPCIEEPKWQLIIALTCMFVDVFCSFFSVVPFFCFFHVCQLIFRVINPWVSTPPWVDKFRRLAMQAFVLPISTFHTLDTCTPSIYFFYYVWWQSNISAWSITFLQKNV
jgi:hypothetical protein